MGFFKEMLPRQKLAFMIIVGTVLIASMVTGYFDEIVEIGKSIFGFFFGSKS